MKFDPGLIIDHGPGLLHGLLVTVEMCGIAIAGGMVLGLLIALAGTVPFRPLQLAIVGYVAVLRGTPLLIQLFIIYYGGPAFNLVLSAFTAGLIGLCLYSSAYFSEIMRAGFASIPRGQIETARVLGISRASIFRRIELPQMMALIIPPMTNQIIGLIKDSAVLSIITVPELTFVTTRMVTSTFSVAEPYLMLAMLYWAITYAVSRAGWRIEWALTRYLR